MEERTNPPPILNTKTVLNDDNDDSTLEISLRALNINSFIKKHKQKKKKRKMVLKSKIQKKIFLFFKFTSTLIGKK